MADRTYSEILEIATTLENDFKELREDAENRYKLYMLRLAAELPEDQAREGQIDVLSPMVMHSAHTIRADLMMNPTEFTCIPLAREPGGAIPVRDQKRADALERSLATIWGRLNEGRRIDRDVIWHQLVSPFAVMILECNDIDPPDQGEKSDEEYVEALDSYQRTRMLWNVTVPDPLTCAFLERAGVPRVFVRRYKMLIRDVEETYSQRRGSPNPNMSLQYVKDHWEWAVVSDDYDPLQWRNSSTGLREVEMIWLDDGKTIYHVALNGMFNGGKTSGELVWSGPNQLGRVSAFIIPSSITPLRTPTDRYEPYLLPLMQTVFQLNKIRTIRATASKNAAGPSTYIPLDPNIQLEYLKGDKPLPKSHRWKANETPYLLGPVMEKPIHVDPDLDKLEQLLQQDLQRLLPSPFVSVLDPAVLRSATATSILHASEAAMRMYGPLMSAYDSGIRDLSEALLYSITNYYKDEPIYTYATGDELVRGVNLKEGEGYTISAKDIAFPYRVQVKTRSMTQAQAAAQYDLVLKQWILPDGSKGPATFDDLLDAANYPDKEAQKEALAAERVLNTIDPMIQQLAVGAALARIQMSTGIDVQSMYGAMVGGGDGAPGSGGPPSFPGAEASKGSTPAPSRLPNSAQRMDSPMIMGPQGGSSPMAG